MTRPRVLVLGGTGEARELAAALTRAGVPVISSLAGRVKRPRVPEGDLRVGGFGGPDFLARWLEDNDITAVVDATHPFAAHISSSAVIACASAGVPLLRLERPGWTAGPDDDWHWVADAAAAAGAIPPLGERVFLTTGRQGLALFADVPAWFLVRCIDPPHPPLPARHELVLDRGPYTLEGELALFEHHEIDLLVTKDSGGRLTEAKLEAARRRALPVIVIRRPDRPAVTTVEDVPSALEWLRA